MKKTKIRASEPYAEDESGKVSVRYGETTFQGNFLRDLRIKDTQINEMLTDQPAKFAFWANLATLQQHLYERKKLELEVLEAQLYGVYRKRGEQQGGAGRVTDKSVDSEVKRDPRRIEKAEAVLKAKYQAERLGAIKYAFAQRKDMLMSLGANLREEMGETGIRLKEKRFLEDRLTDTAKRGKGAPSE